MKYLIFDATNILYRTFYAYKNEDDQTLAGMAHHIAMTTLKSYYNKYKPDKIIMCFDRANWRKEYTMSDECVSGKLYKGGRRQNMTDAEWAKYEAFKENMADFEQILRDHTSVICMAGDGLEADDLIAACVEYYTLEEDNQLVVVSADKDMIQLLRFDNVLLIEPAKGKERTLAEWNGDADWFMFEKCFRGEPATGDNVQNAFPGVRKTRLQRAYEDPLEHESIMHHEWTAPGPDGKTFVVKDLFKENQMLMDLSKQPEDIRKKMFSVVLEAEANPGKFSYFHFMKFLGKYKLDKLAASAKDFAQMLSR